MLGSFNRPFFHFGLTQLCCFFLSSVCEKYGMFKWKSWETSSMPLRKEEAGLMSTASSTFVLFCFWNRTFYCRLHFSSEVLFQGPCSPSRWCVYHVYLNVYWDLLCPNFPLVRNRDNLKLYKVAYHSKGNKNRIDQDAFRHLSFSFSLIKIMQSCIGRTAK